MQSKYYELTIKLNDDLVEFIADFVANIVNEGVELSKGAVIVRSESDLTYAKDALLSFAETLGETLQLECILEEKENQDWIESYQKSVQPIEVEGFYIFPSWHQPKEELINIKIDPALAFGSGHHATTYSCLKAISKYVQPKMRVVDVGCGSGILGLAATKLGAHVDLCDTDPLSVKSSQENFALNNETYTKLWEGSINQANERYDIVIANIIADVLRFIASDLKSSLKNKGYLILSGILDTKEASVKEAFEDLNLIERIPKDEWVTLIYKKDKA